MKNKSPNEEKDENLYLVYNKGTARCFSGHHPIYNKNVNKDCTGIINDPIIK